MRQEEIDQVGGKLRRERRDVRATLDRPQLDVAAAQASRGELLDRRFRAGE